MLSVQIDANKRMTNFRWTARGGAVRRDSTLVFVGKWWKVAVNDTVAAGVRASSPRGAGAVRACADDQRWERRAHSRLREKGGVWRDVEHVVDVREKGRRKTRGGKGERECGM